MVGNFCWSGIFVDRIFFCVGVYGADFWRKFLGVFGIFGGWGFLGFLAVSGFEGGIGVGTLMLEL